MRMRWTPVVVALLLGLSASGRAQDSPGGLPPPHPPGSPVRSGAIQWYGKAPPGPVVTGMKLLAPGVGWAERSQHVYLTKDGGADWSDITPALDADARLSSIFFLDPSTGWIAINHYEPPSDEPRFDLASTTDAGATWSRTTFPLRPKDYGISTEFPLRGGAETVAFVDPLHGWMNVWFAGQTRNTWQGFLLLTSDGGRTWKQAADAPGLSQTQMLLVTPSEGWLFGVNFYDSHHLYVTRDGARSWQEVEPEPAGLADSQVMGLPTFSDARHGSLQMNGSLGSGQQLRLTMVLMATSDGGRTWKPDRTIANLDDRARTQYGSPTVVGSVWIFAASSSDHHPVLTRVAAGARIDAGAEAAAPRPLYRDIRHLSFATPADGWVVVDDGGLLATADGGATWTDISPGPKPHIIHPLRSPSSGESPSEWSAPASPIPSPTASRGRNRVRFSSSDSFGQNAPPSKHLGFEVQYTGTEAEMQQWWNFSPYHDVGVYLAGAVNHGPSNEFGKIEDRNLYSSTWLDFVMGLGWGVMPIWVGPQDPCVHMPKGVTLVTFRDDPNSFLSSEGSEEAHKALNYAFLAGIPAQSIIYYDMETYDASCHPVTHGKKRNPKVTVNGSLAAIDFLQGWTSTLHSNGFAAGVYVSGSNAGDLQAINPDAVWVAVPGPPSKASIWQLNKPIGSPYLGSPYLPESQFVNHQRIHQYNDGPQAVGIANVAWGGVMMNAAYNGGSQLIDLDIEDAPVVGGGGTKTFPGGFTEYMFNNAGACDAAPPPGPFATCDTYATGINDPDLDAHQQYGQITGFFYVRNFAGGAPAGYLSEDGFVTQANNYHNWGALDCPGDIDEGVNTTLPLGINNLGVIVGGYADSYHNIWAFSGSSDPNFPGGTCLSENEVPGFSFNGLNDIDWIVGYDFSQSQNFLLGDTGETPLTGMPNGVQSVNGFGQVVGNDSSFLGVLVDYSPSSGLSPLYPEMSDSASGISNGVEVALQNGYLLQDPDNLDYLYTYMGLTSPTFLGINDYNEVVGYDQNPEYPYSNVGMLLLPN